MCLGLFWKILDKFIFIWQICQPHAQPRTWRTKPPYLYPPEAGLSRYGPGHWVAPVPRDHHFPYPLPWAPEGISEDNLGDLCVVPQSFQLILTDHIIFEVLRQMVAISCSSVIRPISMEYFQHFAYSLASIIRV
jgi:hypothetical protein